jgi:pyrroline-5-carboxylate reductase
MNNHSAKVGFLGAGNMASALIKGIIESGLYRPSELLASDKDPITLDRIQKEYGVQCHGSNRDLVRASATIILCVKPQNMKDVLTEVKGNIREDHFLISIAAGIPLQFIHAIVARDIPLVRVMPNTPALVLMGASALAAGEFATPQHMAAARDIFQAVGETVEVQEEMLDAVTALSGSGPGYVFRLMECMVEAGVAVGLETDTCLRLVKQTFLGESYLAKESGEPLDRLRKNVTSPGGTTEAGLSVLDGMGLEEVIGKGIEAAWKRSLELGKMGNQ